MTVRWALDDVTVRFGAAVALDRVSLDIADDRTVVILGPSGCGKSTLLRALAGLEPLSEGRVMIHGEDATGREPHRRGIGMMFQHHALFPHRDVGANVAFGLRMQRRTRPDRDARVADMLRLVGLEGYAGRDVATLSGGEAQRVALARALAPEPRLLLLDEPLGSLDRELRDRLAGELPGLLRAAGTAAVHVTHDHDEAFAVADRLVVMAGGRVLREGLPAEVWSDPGTEQVARVLGHRNVVTSRAGRQVLLPDAAVLDPGGDLEVQVVSTRFRGDHHEVVVMDVDLGELRFHLPTAPDPGSTVRLRLDPARVASLAGS